MPNRACNKTEFWIIKAEVYFQLGTGSTFLVKLFAHIEQIVQQALRLSILPYDSVHT